MTTDSTNITPITISNNLFMCGTEQWAPKGVGYQPKDFVDPINDSDNLADIKALLDPTNTLGFHAMGLNAVRIYQIDPTKDHQKVMDAFAAAGIYVLVGAVNNNTTVFSGPTAYNQRLEAVADAFCQYKNVLGFSIGNESIAGDHIPGYDIPTKIRAGAKHLKTYMASKGYRAVPVTAAVMDIPQYTIPAAKAYMCGDASERLDFLGYNCERWGEGSLAAKVGAYYDLANALKGFNPVPIIFSEMGTNPLHISPRTWEQIPYLYGVKEVIPQSGSGSLNMADIVSGGFAFRYYNRTAGWGMLTPEGKEIPNYGANSLISENAKITSFSSTGNTMGTVPCDPTNPYVAGGLPSTGGLAADTPIKFTFDVAESTSIVLNYSKDTTSSNWVALITGALGDPTASAVLPKGTEQVSVAYQKDGNWYGACSILDATTISANDTISGQWVAPNGTGTCAIS